MTKRKSDKKSEKNTKYKLPKVIYPKLGLPANPVGAAPDTVARMGCDGETRKEVDYKNSPIPAPAKGVKRILIGLPILTYSHEFVQSFLKFWTELATMDVKETGYECGYYFVHRKPVHMADQTIAEVALYNKATHVLFIDDDIFDITKEMLDKLIAADKDVISGVMMASKFPYAMCVFRRYDRDKKVIDMPSDNSMYRLYEVPCKCEGCGIPVGIWGDFHCPKCGKHQDNSIQKADLIPFPFTLMKTTIFDKIKQPWFHCTNNYPADSWFSDRCIEAGIQQWAHMQVRLTHDGINDLTKPHFFQAELAKNKAADNKGIIAISQDDMEKHEFMLNQKMKEAENKIKYSGAEFPKQTGKSVVKNSADMVDGGKNDGKKSNRSGSVQRKKSIQGRKKA